MLRIVLDGTDLDLTETNLRWESVNTLFEDNALQSDYSFPFTLVCSDINMRALGYAHKADVPTISVTFDIILFLGQRSIRSKLIINGTKKGGINVNISGGIMGLVNADKSLKDLNYITATNDGMVHRASPSETSQVFREVDWKNIIAFPSHYNPSFYGDSNPDFNGTINRYTFPYSTLLWNQTLTGNKYCQVPFVYIFYILKTIAEENLLSLTGNAWNDVELSSALLYNNFALDLKKTVGCKVLPLIDKIYPSSYGGFIVFSEIAPGAYDDDGWDLDTYFIQVGGEYSLALTLHFHLSVTADFQFFIYKNGALFAEYFPGGTITFAGNSDHTITILATDTSVFGDYYQITLVGSAVNIKKESTFIIDKTDETFFNKMEPNITIKNHVPDMVVSDFLKGIKNWGQIEFNIDWDERTIEMNFAERTILNKPAIDLTNLADPDYEQIFDDKNQGFVLSYDFGSQDALLTDNFKPYNPDLVIGEYNTVSDLPAALIVGYFAVIKNSNKLMQTQIVSGVLHWVDYSDYYYPITVGNGTKIRQIEFAPMFMTRDGGNEYVDGGSPALMPAIFEGGTSIPFDLESEPSLRIVFMRGMNQDSSWGGYYVYASATNIDINGNILGDYNLKLQGSDGWYIRFLQKILLAIDNAAIFQYLIMLPASYLKYRGKVQIKNVNYLVKNVSMYIGSTIKPSIVKLLKL